MPIGYSGTPLAKKLGIREGSRLWVHAPPDDYLNWLAPLPAGVQIQQDIQPRANSERISDPGSRIPTPQYVDIVHLFVVERDVLERGLATLRQVLRAEAAVWISWPKKKSKVLTTITEDTIRELALPLGFVDIKVCAVSEVWSGLKLVVRRELR